MALQLWKPTLGLREAEALQEGPLHTERVPPPLFPWLPPAPPRGPLRRCPLQEASAAPSRRPLRVAAAPVWAQAASPTPEHEARTQQTLRKAVSE